MSYSRPSDSSESYEPTDSADSIVHLSPLTAKRSPFTRTSLVLCLSFLGACAAPNNQVAVKAMKTPAPIQKKAPQVDAEVGEKKNCLESSDNKVAEECPKKANQEPSERLEERRHQKKRNNPWFKKMRKRKRKRNKKRYA
jgi:hypothetical protein